MEAASKLDVTNSDNDERKLDEALCISAFHVS